MAGIQCTVFNIHVQVIQVIRPNGAIPEPFPWKVKVDLFHLSPKKMLKIVQGHHSSPDEVIVLRHG